MRIFYTWPNPLFRANFSNRSVLFALRSTLLLCLLVSLLPSVVSAQGPATGTPPLSSSSGGPDVIDNANLNIHVSIPILHKPGRGMPFIYDLSYDSSVWYPVTSGSTTSWQPTVNFGWRAVTGTAALTGFVVFAFVSSTQANCPPFPPPGPGNHITTNTFSNFTYHDPFGVVHPFSGTRTETINSCPGQPTTINFTSFSSRANDGSGLNLTYPAGSTIGTGTVTTPENVVLTGLPQGQGVAGPMTERNGNNITFDSSGHFFDTLSTTAAVLTVAGNGTTASPITFAYTDSSGNSGVKYTMNYTNYTVATNFGVSGFNEYKSSGAVPLVTSIILPDNSQYTFTYEPTPGTCTPYSGTTCVTARIASVQLPTGGTIFYVYYNSGGNFSACTVGNNGVYSDGSAACLKRTTPDGTWTYIQAKGTGAASTTTITAPVLPYDSGVANQTVIQFQGIYETQRKVYQGAATGTALSTVDTCYNAVTIPCTGTVVALPITQKTVKATVPGPGGLNSQHIDKFDSFGNLTESDDYDYFTTGTPPLVKQTLITYASLGNNLNAFRQTVTVKDGSGNIKSRQDTTYDQYTSFTGNNCVTGAANHDDTGHGCSFTARANATSITTYTDPVTPSGGITKNFTYDSLGNLRTAQLNCCQVKTFNFSTTTQYAYPDNVVSGSTAPTLTTAFTYDLHMGLMLSTTDPNNVQTTNTYDNMGRILTTKTGTNPTTNFTYTDSGTWSVLVCAPVQGTNTVCQKSILDSLGRPATSKLLDGGGMVYSASDTQYDPIGRAYRSSDPYPTSPSYWTQSNFDALGRLIKITLPDTSFSTANYADNTVVTTDPAGIQRESVSDGLGRLTSVFEPDPAGGAPTVQTSYAYNIAGELTTVTEGSQTRTYTYDALWRLLSSTTPEAGTICFGSVTGTTCNSDGYDSFDNLLQKTDGRGVVTNYLYDSLNRLVGITYPTVPAGVAAMPNVCKVNGSGTNNANVCFVYGTTAASFNNGRLASMNDPSGSESYTYDQFGNVTQLGKTVAGTPFTTSYSYNLANQLTQITYPSGRAVAQGLDAIGRLSSIVGTLNSVQTTYASGYLYNTAQQMTGFKYGNNIYASFGFYADTLMLKCLDYSTTNRNGTCVNDGTSKFGLQYAYPTAPANNGRISTITDAVDNGRTATYTYDALYRLSSAVTTGSTNYPQWGLSESYDRYGNRTAQGTITGKGCTGITCPTSSVTVGATTNRLIDTGYSYDASGNMTNDGANTLTYDGENRTTNAANGTASGSYSYDGNGLRVLRTSNISGVTTNTVYIFSGTKVIAEYDYTTGAPSPTSPNREYIYSGATLIAKIDSITGTKYYHQDHLSNRLVTDSTGNTNAQMGHFPFGESWYNASNDKLIFTSYERDKESGNDYAQARYYVSRLGRFSSPDSLSGSLADPQSLNRYSYVQNDPINATDPSGACDPWDMSWLSDASSDPGCFLGQGGGGGGGGGGGNPTLTNECNFDGVVTPCAIAQAGATFCPPGGCFWFSPSGNFYAFYPEVGGNPDYVVRPGGFVDERGDEDSGLSDPENANALAPDTSKGGSLSPDQVQHCIQKILSALNNKLGTNFTDANVSLVANAGVGVAVNLYMDAQNGVSLTAQQFNAIVPGARWSVNSGFASSVLGLGPSIHIADPHSFFDRKFATYQSANIAGLLSVQFTVHIDSGNPNRPLGVFWHPIRDVIAPKLGKPRNPCP